MTESKPIMIDGVDVSKCVYHDSEYCTISKEAYCYCCDKPNCYFKQLARYKQTVVTIQGLAQSINDAFEEDDVEQQLSYCKDIGFQIEKICEVENDRN